MMLNRMFLVLAALFTPVIAAAEDITAEEAYRRATAGAIVIVDIRHPEEWAQTGVPEGAKAITLHNRSFGPNIVALAQANPEQPLALICSHGNRSSYAFDALQKAGLQATFLNIKEGMQGSRAGPGWIKKGLPTEKPTP